jgi:hypothetical protein
MDKIGLKISVVRAGSILQTVCGRKSQNHDSCEGCDTDENADEAAMGGHV